MLNKNKPTKKISKLKKSLSKNAKQFQITIEESYNIQTKHQKKVIEKTQLNYFDHGNCGEILFASQKLIPQIIIRMSPDINHISHFSSKFFENLKKKSKKTGSKF